MENIIPSGQLIKLLHDRLEKQANNTLRGKDLTMMQISVLMEQMLLHGFSEDEKAIFNQLLARAAENMK